VSPAAANSSLFDRLERAGAYVANVIRGGKPPPKKRWSSTYVLNLVSCTAIVLILLINVVIANWRIGLNTQNVRCLPGSVFLIAQNPPDTIARGAMVAYRSKGLQPLLRDGSTVAKLVAAIPGDRVKVDANGVSVNGKRWGPLNQKVMAKTGKTIASVTTEYTVKPDELLVLGVLPRSYDGRYWGPIKKTQVIGKAWRLW